MMIETHSKVITVTEPLRETKVCYEADIVVMGGGPGGHSAAIAAARSGVKTVLLERYGHLGGMSTGGLVILIHHMSDGTAEQQIAGLCQEWLDRLYAKGGALGPHREEVGSAKKVITNRWQNLSHFFVVGGRVALSAKVDPEILKCVLNEMAQEAGVKLLLHAWGTQTISDGHKVQGVIFESKSGRQAILAKIVIDGTGDGDLIPSAGVEFDSQINPSLRISQAALCFEFANVDFKKTDDFKKSNPLKYEEMMGEIGHLDGFTSFLRTTHQNVVLFNTFIPGLDVLAVEDLTQIEVNVRKRMLITYDFYKKYVPGFENCFIMTTAPQLGIRGSRRLSGEYVLTEKDIQSGTVFDDTVAVFPPSGFVVSSEHPHVYFPYRSLLPRKVEGLLVAGRSYSSKDVFNDSYNSIAHYIAIGQAAGTAAALAVTSGRKLRDIDKRKLQHQLVAQGVPMPGVMKTQI